MALFIVELSYQGISKSTLEIFTPSDLETTVKVDNVVLEVLSVSKSLSHMACFVPTFSYPDVALVREAILHHVFGVAVNNAINTPELTERAKVIRTALQNNRVNVNVPEINATNIKVAFNLIQ